MRSITICLLCCTALILKPCFSQTKPPEELLLAGEFRLAAIEFERMAWRSSDIADFNRYILEESRAYKFGGLYQEALKCLQRLNYVQVSDSQLVQFRYETALCAYLDGNFVLSESQIIQLRAQLADSSLNYATDVLMILVLNEQEKWKEAGQELSDFIDRYPHPAPLIASLKQLHHNYYSEGKTPKLKNRAKAEKLNLFLPAIGYFYAGAPTQGFISMGFQVLSLGATVYGYWIGYYITSTVLGIRVLEMFHLGSMKHAGDLVDKRNKQLKRSFNDAFKSGLTGYLGTKKP